MSSHRLDRTLRTLALLALAAALAGCSGDDGGDGRVVACVEGERRCSEDAAEVQLCRDGAWIREESCATDLVDEARLCEAATCVAPWRYGAPTFDACVDDPFATPESLAAKAEHYDRLARVLHVHPDDQRIHPVTLTPGTDESSATWRDVVDWRTGENDGLWTGLYITSQAFRHAATGSAEALENLRVMMDGLERGMRITGVPGLFTREYVTPGIDGMACPSDPAAYVPDVEKDDNRSARVDDDGTILVADPVTLEMVRTEHRVPAEYAGYCWLDNVSQDEYAGHMLALSSIWKLVDDSELRARAAALLGQVGDHLVAHRMRIVDWDGRGVEHARFYPWSLDQFPDFNATLGLSYLRSAAVATGRADLFAWYGDCLLQRSGENDCLERPLNRGIDYSDGFEFTGLYPGPGGCLANWNNHGMQFLAMFTLLWFETDPELRPMLQDFFVTKMFRNARNGEREIAKQSNAAWTFQYAAMKPLGPGTDGPDLAALRDAVCALRQFPASKSTPSLDVGEERFPTDPTCESRFAGRFLTYDPVPVHLRCPHTFTWWANPYRHQSCTENPLFVQHGADYLMAYWMGRYFGFVDPSW